MKTFRYKVPSGEALKQGLTGALSALTKLDASKLGDAAQKGALWMQKGGKGKTLRIRALNVHLNPGDLITFFYDPKVLTFPELASAECIAENDHYGIWVKAAGVMPQGTQAADHTSLLRYIERLKKKEIYLIHRLDRETEGLMIFGYSSEAAAKISDLFQKNLVKKTYEAIVLGEIEKGFRGSIDSSLDDKEALTHYTSLGNKNGKSLLSVTIETGRLHQIRRHLDGIGHPVMGDPLYGKGNKNREGLKLLAKSLSFQDPWTRKDCEFILNKSLSI